MPYRLQKAESLAAGLKRIADDQLAGAIQSLQSAQDFNQAIYNARKFLKKARSIMRLLQPKLGVIYLEENRRLGDIARRFSGLRDLQVSLELLDQFSKQYKRKSTLNPQRSALSAKQVALQNAIDWHGILAESIALLTATRKRIEDWPIHNVDQAFVESQIRKTHKRSGCAMQKAFKTRLPEDFHEFRKSVKRELNQSRLLELETATIDDLKMIAKLLGDHHNVAVLMLTLESASHRFRAMLQRNLRQLETAILAPSLRIYSMKHQAAVA